MQRYQAEVIMLFFHADVRYQFQMKPTTYHNLPQNYMYVCFPAHKSTILVHIQTYDHRHSVWMSKMIAWGFYSPASSIGQNAASFNF